MDHDHNVRAAPQRFEVAGFLVATIATVLDMDDDLEAKALGDIYRVVMADIIDEDDFVDHVHRQPTVGRFEGPRRVVRGHDHHHPGCILHRRGPMIVGSRKPARA